MHQKKCPKGGATMCYRNSWVGAYVFAYKGSGKVFFKFIFQRQRERQRACAGEGQRE